MTATINRPRSKPLRKRRTYVPTGEVGEHLAAAAALITQIKALEAQLEPHREFLLNHLKSRDLSLVTQGQVQAHRKVRHKWTYSPSTERDALALRQLQKWEQAQGIAQDDPTVYVAITFAKP